MFKNKVILVTGGTGSFGKIFIKKIKSYQPKKIIIFRGMNRSKMICKTLKSLKTANFF